MSVHKYTNKSGTHWEVRYTTPLGTRSRKRGFRTKTQATAWEQQQRLTPATPETTINDWADAYRNEIVHLRATTIDVYTICLDKHVLPQWGTRNPHTITGPEVQTWINTNHYTRPQAERVLRILRRLCQLAGAHDPTLHVRKPPKPQGTRAYLNADQLHLLALESDYPEIIYTLGTVGIRWGELAALTTRDYNHQRHTLTINKQYATVRGHLVPGPPKNGKPRQVSVPGFVGDLLAQQQSGQQPGAPLFRNRYGEVHKRPKGQAGWFAGACRRAQDLDWDFPDGLRIHDLRHTAASLMVAGGAHVKMVQAQLGHASASMTLDVYADLFPEDLSAVGRAMDGVLGVQNVSNP